MAKIARILVVGGGIAGLSAAIALNLAGFQVEGRTIIAFGESNVSPPSVRCN
jgi:glycine/D-amino acid oxidase-like deaminating enzyme